LIPPIPNLVSSLVVLLPLGIYCVIIARINRRQHPLLVSGVRDCAGMLLALSGFLLFVIPSILTGFNYRPRDIWLFIHYGNFQGLGHEWWLVWWTFLWFLYVLVVFGGSCVLLWHRRRATSIYNVEPRILDEILEQVLKQLELGWVREGKRIYFGQSNAPNPGAYLEIDSWPAWRHVTLRWTRETEHARSVIEEELGRALAEVRTIENPASHWLMTASAFVFTLMFVLTVLLQIERMRQGKL
jgi:hypothetical protein